jgi:aldehyde:ferredoxin oxidoreductase
MSQQGGGGLPTNNWDAASWPTPKRSAAKSCTTRFCAARKKANRTKTAATPATPASCAASASSSPSTANIRLRHEYGGPEYETIATFGSYCGVDDLHAVTYANQLCNEYGVDTISCGATISWAMECFEHELLTWKRRTASSCATATPTR